MDLTHSMTGAVLIDNATDKWGYGTGEEGGVAAGGRAVT